MDPNTQHCSSSHAGSSPGEVLCVLRLKGNEKQHPSSSWKLVGYRHVTPRQTGQLTREVESGRQRFSGTWTRGVEYPIFEDVDRYQR